ncbi:MFS general substrate transporter [Schizopora paradoxa]|uniref:MFS general substrate transporter n=1 Tax=Schizopora paradoxa TaxID=27342 RepID=A0A0H2RRZ8_9AGAM|nr:MFS general substrate transporter [Schizopora paradoxa]
MSAAPAVHVLPADKRVSTRKSALIPSATPTIVDDASSRTDGNDNESINEREGRELYPGPDEQKTNPYLVEFGPDDKENPKNWSRIYRWYLTMLGGLLVLNATFASSAPSGVAGNLMEYFTFSEEVATLTISLFVAGYCVGPLLWGPLSESFGRRPIFIFAFIVYTGFQVGSALSRNTASILIFRLLGGTFAAAPLTNSGALISDIWDPATRGKALALFTLAPFAGPALGPLVGGYISVSGTSWRWVFWVSTIFAGVCTVLIVVTLPETYAPKILVQKARRIRKETGDSRYFAPLEDQEKESFAKQLNRTIGRPFKVLFQEPMLIAISLYMSFVYGCIYLLFEAYPIVFVEGHHMTVGSLGLTFLPIFLGGICGVVIYLAIFNPRYVRLMEKFSPNPVPPEYRLELAILGAPIFAISFFWFGWTSFPSVSYWAPLTAGFAIGVSTIMIFNALFNYIIDAYLFVAASALSSSTVMRSSFGAAFPLFATQMFDSLNPRWASTLLGFVALAMVPIPLILIKFGPALRRRSKHAPSRPLDPPAEVESEEEKKKSPETQV